MEQLQNNADAGVAVDCEDGRDFSVGTVVVTLGNVAPADLGRPKYPRIATESSDAASEDVTAPDRVWRWTVAVQGTCRRASTTVADRRRDALFTATRFIETAKRIVRFERTRMGATIRHSPCEPTSDENAAGQHVLCLELRDTDPATIGRIYERLVAEAWTIGRLSSSVFTFTPLSSNPTVLYDVDQEPPVAAPQSTVITARHRQDAVAAQSSRAG